MDSLLTIRDVMRVLRVSRGTAYTLIKSGVIDSTKIGGDWRVRRSALNAYIDRDKHKKTGGSI